MILKHLLATLLFYYKFMFFEKKRKQKKQLKNDYFCREKLKNIFFFIETQCERKIQKVVEKSYKKTILKVNTKYKQQ